MRWVPVAVVLSGFNLGPVALGQPQGQPQKLQPPKWLSDEGKDLFTEVNDEEHWFGDAACDGREKLLKAMAGKSERDAADHRVRVLLHLGLCEYRKGNYKKSAQRIDSAIGEMNVPSEDVLMKNPPMAPIPLMKQAAIAMQNHELTQAGTALRRTREVIDRSLRKTLKMLHKQLEQQGSVPPLEILIAEIPGFGYTGDLMPNLVMQVPQLKQDLQWMELVEAALDNSDKLLAQVDASVPAKRSRLSVSKSQSKAGSLLYVRTLATGPLHTAKASLAAQQLIDLGVTKAFVKEGASKEKSASLLSHTKEGGGCKQFPKTCEKLEKVEDVKSNGFGDTRVLVVKAGKKQELDLCNTNANVGILVAATGGAKVSVGSSGEEAVLEGGTPTVVDFCQKVVIEASEATTVLFAQAWHPEFAAVERSGELRARSEAFGLSENEVKAATKVVNDYAKKSWDKVAKAWRQNSPLISDIKSSLKAEAEALQQQQEAAAEEARRMDEANDETRKKNLEELERKRAEKRKAEELAEAKRLEHKRKLEMERASRDPWLNSPEVSAAEQNLADLKEARRDANAKLEFDLSTQLTKDISAAERQVKKVIKQAKKAYKKAGKEPQGDGVQQPVNDHAEELAKLKAELEEVSKKKVAAADAEEYKEAKRLKQEESKLEEQISKLEL